MSASATPSNFAITISSPANRPLSSIRSHSENCVVLLWQFHWLHVGTEEDMLRFASRQFSGGLRFAQLVMKLNHPSIGARDPRPESDLFVVTRRKYVSAMCIHHS